MPSFVVQAPETALTVQQEGLLLKQILKQVSRSFYLSLIILPRSVRQQVGLAYLFCRAADTIADTDLLPRHQRLQGLQLFREQLHPSASAMTHLESLQKMLSLDEVTEGERQLFLHLSECLQLLASLPPADQHLIRELVCTLTQGMDMDLSLFPGETATTACALPDVTTLDRYTYYVAGVVGEFWTKIHQAYLTSLTPEQFTILCDLGICFG